MDQEWVGRALFVKKGKLTSTLTLWWHPPGVDYQSSPPKPDTYHRRRLLMWSPRMMWQVNIYCPRCGVHESLRSKGLYNHVRLVMDLKDYYYVAAEYMDCRACLGTFIAWDPRILDQLASGVRARFPVLMTHKYACDQSVIALLHSRTLGNSPTALRNTLQEIHSEEWLRKQLDYLTRCQRNKKSHELLHLPIPEYQKPLPFPPFPTSKWFLAAYVRDVWSRMDDLLAAATSTHGSILKIDSTKKICNKLQGADANTASWATNVGNERGEVLMCVLTTSEGVSAMQPMADGLMSRYECHKEPPPSLIYTDRDCCNTQGPSKYQVLFHKWDLCVRLDIWHYMRRIAVGCTTESHPLYATFMSRLSSAIFEWDMEDVERLMSAKKGEMAAAGIPNPSSSAVRKAITKDEMARHCKRRTRGIKQTTEAIEALLLSFSTATDTLGVPLLKEDIKSIWEEQQKHVTCIQDPTGVELYTVTGHIHKGGMMLPVLRCARGSTSLESFHLHLARFVPGTSAGAINFQAYILDGITRWNAARSASAVQTNKDKTLRTFNTRLQCKVPVYIIYNACRQSYLCTMHVQ